VNSTAVVTGSNGGLVRDSTIIIDELANRIAEEEEEEGRGNGQMETQRRRKSSVVVNYDTSRRGSKLSKEQHAAMADAEDFMNKMLSIESEAGAEAAEKERRDRGQEVDEREREREERERLLQLHGSKLEAMEAERQRRLRAIETVREEEKIDNMM
jgi:hypothetical protein